MRQTSISANKRAEATGLKQAHQLKILRFLEKNKRGTAAHIAKGTKLDYHQVMRRTSELERNQKIASLGKIGFSPNMQPALVWEILKPVKD